MAGRHDTTTALRLVTPSSQARLLFFVLSVPLTVLIAGTVLTLSVTMPGAATPQLLFESRLLTVLLPLALIVVVSSVLWFVFDRLMLRSQATLDGQRFDLVVAWFKRNYTLSELRLAEARIVDLGERTELRPRMKRRAIRTPGYRCGSFRLRNGTIAFVAMGPGPRVLVIPTTRRESLLLEFEQPQAALDVLRAAADSTGSAR